MTTKTILTIANAKGEVRLFKFEKILIRLFLNYLLNTKFWLILN